MDPSAFEKTRRTLHGLAELVLAGPQYGESQDIRLRALPGGFGTVSEPDVRVEGIELVVRGERCTLEGTIGEVAARAGLAPRALADVYADGAGVGTDEPVTVDPAAAAEIADAFSRGDAALRTFAPSEEPVLWPEHFDIGISLDEVNYGVSPGDAHVAEPYAYIGPWTPKRGAFWNEAFGAAQPMRGFSDVDGLVEFFRTGAERARTDPDA